MAAAGWSWEETQAMLQRLHQPTAATVAAEYTNIAKLTDFMAAVIASAPRGGAPSIAPRQDQLRAMMQRWCSMAKPLLLLLMNQDAMMRHPGAVTGTGILLSLLANGLEVWIALAPNRAAKAAVKQEIAQHTAGLVPVLGKLMSAVAEGISKSTARRQRRAQKAESADDAAEAAHARGYFPHHPDIAMGVHLLSFWKGLAGTWPGTLLRTSSSSGKARKGGSSSSHGSSSLQETVLPACDLAINLLTTWPPNVVDGSTASSSTSSSSSRDVPDGAIPRSTMGMLMFTASFLLMDATQTELVADDSPLSASDAKFVSRLAASTAVQHLLLLQAACSCHRLHKARQGLSPIKAKAAAAAVSGCRVLAAAAAAAEAAAGSNGSSSSKKQQQYLSVPAHHTAVLDLLLVPADTLHLPPVDEGTLSHQLQAALGSMQELLSGSLGQPHGNGMYKVQGLPKVPVELCAPLHCMLAEAAALAPDQILRLHGVLMSMQILQDVYFGAKMGAGQATAATASTAIVGHTGGLAACLQLMGPAILHAYKHGGTEGDTEMPPGGGGCPLGKDGQPLQGAPLRDATLNLFGSITVKIGSAPACDQIFLAACAPRPFTTAAVCQAVVRGAARHNQMPPPNIRMFATLASDACGQMAAPPISGTRSDLIAAAAADSSTRDAFLLQFGLITTQLKYTSGSCGGTSVVSALLHHVMPTCRTVIALGKLIEPYVGIDSDNDVDRVSCSSVEEQGLRVGTMQPWIHLCGRSLFFAGSQLLLALDGPAVARAAGLKAQVIDMMQQVLLSILWVLVMVGSQIHQLHQLQPEGTCVLPGPPESACEALLELLDGKLAAATHEFEGVVRNYRAAAGIVGRMMESSGNNGSNLAWGHQLQQMLLSAVPQQAATALRDAGAAVCAEFPVKLCCNNPGCTSMAKVGEMLLGSSCSGCKAARYCSKACQGAAWKMGHSKVCKRIIKAAAAAAPVGA